MYEIDAFLVLRILVSITDSFTPIRMHYRPGSHVLTLILVLRYNWDIITDILPISDRKHRSLQR